MGAGIAMGDSTTAANGARSGSGRPPGPASRQCTFTTAAHWLRARPPYPPIAARSDVLVFQTPPLEDEVEVTGPVVVNLWVSSSAPDTDFTAMLVDVYPPNPDYPQGYAMNLADGIKRARYRRGYAKAELMSPGEVYPLSIELGPTSNRFVAGHRIRIHGSSSNFPRFDVNPNTGAPLGTAGDFVVARNTVYLDAERPSHVVLPIVPAENAE